MAPVGCARPASKRRPAGPKQLCPAHARSRELAPRRSDGRITLSFPSDPNSVSIYWRQRLWTKGAFLETSPGGLVTYLMKKTLGRPGLRALASPPASACLVPCLPGDFLFLDLERVWQKQLEEQLKQRGGGVEDVPAGEGTRALGTLRACGAGPNIPGALRRHLHPSDSVTRPASRRERLEAVSANTHLQKGLALLGHFFHTPSGPKDPGLFLKSRIPPLPIPDEEVSLFSLLE
ncbi:unnamed protein product [Rangifer tarandus platyrhynchus]|uniref:Uncharacterized protein n=3 Tax=Rangifer tarandus platyrhynchus TaxID=3082113 RepID=A0AC59ZG85_RANTA|nr:unnamed protein product [Rangifer tarandus platyrhynchus]CAI9703703.1 unnamed protein product [Rangifer tarandus platyrhynchus]